MKSHIIAVVNKDRQKVCYQLVYLPEPTPCFNLGGGRPCAEKGCLVEKALDEQLFVYESLIEQLCHDVCRNSLQSPNNQNYLIRVNK